MARSSKFAHARTAIALLAILAVAAAAAACSSDSSDTKSTTTPAASGNSDEAMVNAYVYTYPLVSVELTRRMMTNVAAPDPTKGMAPLNQLAPLAFLPDADFTAVVKPNVDTLYTSMLFDVAAEPLVVTVPAMGDRYHLFPVLDMWTNVDGAPGSRTIPDAGKGYEFAIVGPHWQGTLPAGVHEYRLPTDAGWMIGRVSVDGPDDVPNVIALQEKTSVVPLSSYGKPYTAPQNTDIHPDWPARQPVADYIHNLTPQQYWDLYYSSLSHTQPRPGDQTLLEQLAKIGWSPDKKLDLSQLPSADAAAWEQAWPKALSQIETKPHETPVNGWQTKRKDIGDYGTDYSSRALVAYLGLGANLPQDAIYPVTYVDQKNAQLESDRNYVLHFDADQIPPVRGFWSVTMYNGKGFFVENPINRFAVRGDRLTKNADGSVDIYIQRENPGQDKEANWLPAPASGDFNLTLRTYWPDQQIVDGDWNPTAVTSTN
ncbi:DUF1254 domain-containing protein [Nocardia yamanashiensis]|uniref:DUF1254 domain-containing protein n=1 Tax=Nocardia yamanashiensis TaxID=209247 RepID=UPI001E5407B9|nr:DUF1254 domain-containing protein [Nocardia yamanashiensis]UGT40786.1 DUF1254 domain-containing protein [Nocardia yamanashiensis]